jgi:hypothetical protein
MSGCRTRRLGTLSWVCTLESRAANQTPGNTHPLFRPTVHARPCMSCPGRTSASSRSADSRSPPMLSDASTSSRTGCAGCWTDASCAAGFPVCGPPARVAGSPCGGPPAPCGCAKSQGPRSTSTRHARNFADVTFTGSRRPPQRPLPGGRVCGPPMLGRSGARCRANCSRWTSTALPPGYCRPTRLASGRRPGRAEHGCSSSRISGSSGETGRPLHRPGQAAPDSSRGLVSSQRNPRRRQDRGRLGQKGRQGRRHLDRAAHASPVRHTRRGGLDVPDPRPTAVCISARSRPPALHRNHVDSGIDFHD